jgi:hypothetical protein
MKIKVKVYPPQASGQPWVISGWLRKGRKRKANRWMFVVESCATPAPEKCCEVA